MLSVSRGYQFNRWSVMKSLGGLCMSLIFLRHLKGSLLSFRQ